MTRKILHLDLDAFFCAVEEQRDTALQGQAFAVGGQPDERGVVSSCSYPARQFGVRSAMPMANAIRLCPGLIVVPPHFDAYREKSRAVMGLLDDLTPFVEQLSIDEAFLDVSLRPEPAETVAQLLQATVNGDLGLPCSLGVATNKLVAKIANNIGKARNRSGQPPNAILVVPPGEEAAFLDPLPIRELWGVGPATAEQLTRLGIRTIGDIARWPEDDLVRRFGKHGRGLAGHARGLDDRPVEGEHETKSISKEITFSRDVRDAATLRSTLRELADGVGLQARREDLSGRTVTLKLRWSDFTTLTRQVTLDHTTAQDNEIFAVVCDLLDRHWSVGKAVRLIGVGLSGFETPHRQLGLWEDAAGREQDRRLQDTLDTIRARFGDGAVRRGSALRRDRSRRKRSRRDRPGPDERH